MTVRAAVNLLGGQGMVATTRGRSGGTVVTGSRSAAARLRRQASEGYAREVAAIYELRQMVEPEVARLAARRATPGLRGAIVTEASLHARTVAEFRANDSRFHLVVAQASGNRFAQQAIQQLREGLFVWLDGLWTELTGSASRSEEEHRQISLAIAAGDETTAQSLMAEHLATGSEGFAKALERIAAADDEGGPAC